MKATGIVRKIDDLGRIVIPKEIRDTHNYIENQPMEIFTEKDMVVLRPYNPDRNKEAQRIIKMIDNLRQLATNQDELTDIIVIEDAVEFLKGQL